jgi:hypothetical protein
MAGDAVMFAVTNSADSEVDILLSGFQVFELPKVQVAGTALARSNEGTLRKDQPIYEDGSDVNNSLKGVLSSLPTCESTTRRALLWQMVQFLEPAIFTGSILDIDPTDYTQYTTTSFPGDAQVSAIMPPILPRQRRGETEVELAYVLIAGVIGTTGQTGEVRIRLRDLIAPDVTDSATETITWATDSAPSLYTGTIMCRCEDVENLAIDPGDVTVGAGWPGGTGGQPDVCELNARVVDATSIYVVYFDIYEAY